ncbi:hypothetical protein CNECB9_3480094 [Cupriavidus necator]|uniref:Uncharacterized protein n=1 Tax=Cupriavidus necator TaxID=106590 RepID=A0A1K0JCR8_CUPNE|nr:hypothetical protein CNECB9_3480094 [Cupriavidus necator]
MFGRQAFAGLAHESGRLTLRRQLNTVYDLLIKYVPTVRRRAMLRRSLD